MTRRWMLIFTALAMLVGILASPAAAKDDSKDVYKEIRQELASPSPSGKLVFKDRRTFEDVPNPCDGSLITVDLKEFVFDQGDGTLLIINRSKISTPTGFKGKGSFWLIVPMEPGPPLDSGFFESGKNNDTDQTYIRYGDFPGPSDGVYEEVCIDRDGDSS